MARCEHRLAQPRHDHSALREELDVAQHLPPETSSVEPLPLEELECDCLDIGAAAQKFRHGLQRAGRRRAVLKRAGVSDDAQRQRHGSLLIDGRAHVREEAVDDLGR